MSLLINLSVSPVVEVAILIGIFPLICPRRLQGGTTSTVDLAVDMARGRSLRAFKDSIFFAPKFMLHVKSTHYCHQLFNKSIILIFYLHKYSCIIVTYIKDI